MNIDNMRSGNKLTSEEDPFIPPLLTVDDVHYVVSHIRFQAQIRVQVQREKKRSLV